MVLTTFYSIHTSHGWFEATSTTSLNGDLGRDGQPWLSWARMSRLPQHWLYRLEFFRCKQQKTCSKFFWTIGFTKKTQGWVAPGLVNSAAQQQHHQSMFCLSVLLSVVCWSCPHCSFHHSCKVALIIPCIQTWQLLKHGNFQRKRRGCLFLLYHFKPKESCSRGSPSRLPRVPVSHGHF